MLLSKCVIRVGDEVIWAGDGVIRAGTETVKDFARQYKNTGFIMLPYPLNNFEVQRYYQNEWWFNNVYSRNRFPKTKNRTYVINFDEYESIATHWKA